MIYYKGHKKPGTEGNDKDDIILIIVQSLQQKMLCKVGYSIICIDSTHDSTEYDCYLATPIVLDKYGSECLFTFVVTKGESFLLTV